MTFEGIENLKPDVSEMQMSVEQAQRTVSECADGAWSALCSNDAVASSIETVQDAAASAWETCAPMLETAGEAVGDGARNGAYLVGRFGLGIADVGENAYIGVKSNVELIMGDEEAAVQTAQIHAIDDVADSWGDFMGASEKVREIGNYAEAGGKITPEVALGAAAMTAAAPVAVATGTVLVASEMGKSLESTSADGEISQGDIVTEMATGGITAATLLVGRGLNNIAKSKASAEVAAEAKAPETGISQDIQPPKTGGSYSELRKYSLETEEVHHMPADSVSTIERADGPAIRMAKEDHRITASCGNSIEAREYRAMQQELISQGKVMDAIQMDIDDIASKFGSKYDEAVAEMLAYATERGYI